MSICQEANFLRSRLYAFFITALRFHPDFKHRRLAFSPSVKTLHILYIGIDDQFIISLYDRVIYGRNPEAARSHLFTYKICKHLVTDRQPSHL